MEKYRVLSKRPNTINITVRFNRPVHAISLRMTEENKLLTGFFRPVVRKTEHRYISNGKWVVTTMKLNAADINL